MDLKTRKRILNLPKFDTGLDGMSNYLIASMDPMALFKSANGGQLPGVAPVIPNLGPAQLSDKALASANKTAMENLPKKGGFGNFMSSKGGDIMNAAASTIDAVSTFSSLGKSTMGSDEMMGSGGTSNESANGISYQQSKVDSAGIQNQINATAKAATMTGLTKGSELGGTIGNFFGPVGGAIGKVGGALFGGIVGGILGNKAKKEAERQKQIAIDRTNAGNTQNREMAYTIGLRNEFNRENRTDTSQSLFHAEEGKEGAVNPRTGATYKKHVVNTAYGKTKAPQNAWVSKGEVIRSKDGSLHIVNEGPNDTARAYLLSGDSVYSKKIVNPETGNPVADDAPVYAAMGMLDRLDMNLNVGRMLKYTGRRKENLLPGYLGGTLKKYALGTPPTENDIDLRWFAGQYRPYENETYGGNQAGNGVDPFGGKYGDVVITGSRKTPSVLQTGGSYLDTITGVGDSMMDAFPGGSIKEVVAYGKMPKFKSLFGDPDFSKTPNIPTIQVPYQNPNASPESTTTNNPSNNNLSKKPGAFGKIKGLIGNIGGNVDLGNLALLGNAYMTAAQRDARAQGLRAPKSFMANPYEQDSLQQLNSLHSDYYPVWSLNREIEGRGKAAIAQSGGLSAGQRMLGYMGLTNQTQQNNANAMFEHQGRENALRSQAAKAALEAGNQSATRQQQAYQWDEDMLAKAHAARENMLETSAYDRQNALGQFLENNWKKNQFNQTMDLYRADQKLKEEDLQFLRDQFLNNNKPGTASQVQNKPTLGDLAKAVKVPQQMPSTTELVKKADIASKVKQPVVGRPKKRTKGKPTNVRPTKLPTQAGSSLEGTMIKRPDDIKPYTFGYTGNPTIEAIKERYPDLQKPKSKKGK